MQKKPDIQRRLSYSRIKRNRLENSERCDKIQIRKNVFGLAATGKKLKFTDNS